MTDKEYEKAEDKSLQDYLNGELRVALRDPIGEHEWLAHKSGFRDGFKLGQSQPVSNPDKFGNSEQLRAQIAKDLYVGGLNHPDGSIRCQCYQNRHKFAKECIEDAEIFLAELDKTKEK